MQQMFVSNKNVSYKYWPSQTKGGGKERKRKRKHNAAYAYMICDILYVTCFIDNDNWCTDADILSILLLCGICICCTNGAINVGYIVVKVEIWKQTYTRKTSTTKTTEKWTKH